MFRTHYVNQLDAGMDGKEVTVAGWLHEIRDIGKIVFLLLRDHTGIVQVVAKRGLTDDKIIKNMLLPKEIVIRIKGIVNKNSESKKGFEIRPLEVGNMNPLSATVPFEVTGKVPADMDVRLDYRYIDLRRLETTAIFNIQSTILKNFRNSLMKKGFQEIVTPSLVEAATEGGTDLFPVQYFEKQAYLTQSPQLYKQLAVIGGMDRIFIVSKALRAEKHNTPFHLNESTQMDIEIGFADHNDAIKMLKYVSISIIKDVVKNNAQDMEMLKAERPKTKIKDMTYKEALKALSKEGMEVEFGKDISRAEEEELYRKYGDLIIIREYPTMERAFYSMPKSGEEDVCNSFDLLFKGLEVASGAQRIHMPDMLVDGLTKRGLNPEDFKFYIDAFRNGAPPHAGWSIGLERMTMKLVGVSNVREASMFPRDRTRVKP